MHKFTFLRYFMKKTSTPHGIRIGRLSFLCLLFGTYAVLCQITMIFLYAITIPITVSTDVICHTVLPWLEYPLMSLFLILVGATLLNYTENSCPGH